MATERIDIIVAENGSRTVRRNLQDVGNTGAAAAKGVNLLKGALASLGVGLAVSQLIRLADTFTTIQNRLRLVTTGMSNLKAVNDELFASANRTYASYEATADLYASLARSTQQLGLSQRQLLTITETINQAIAISGTEASTAANGLRQLGQGLASGTLRGDELNSVLENMPRLATAIATGMGVTVGQLRKLGAEGKITADNITSALLKAGPEVQAEFARINPTISNTFQVLENNVVKFIGQLNTGTGVGAAFGQVILFIANHLDGIATGAAAVAAAFAWSSIAATVSAVLGPVIALEKALGATSVVSALFSAAMKLAQGAVNGLTAALLANPFTAIAAAIAIAVTAIMLFGDQVKLTSDGAVTLKDAFLATLSLIWDMVKTVAAAFMEAWDATIGAVTSLLASFGVSWGDVFGFIWNIVKTTINAIIGYYVFAFNTIKSVWNNLPGAMDLIFTTIVNIALAGLEKIINAWQLGFRGIAGILSYVNQDAADGLSGALDRMTIKLPRAKLSAAGQAMGQTVARNFNEAFTTDYLGNAGSAIIERARRMNGGAGQDALNPAGKRTLVPDAGKGGKGKKPSDEETRAEYLAKLTREANNAISAAQVLDSELGKVQAEVAGINEHLKEKNWALLDPTEQKTLTDLIMKREEELRVAEARKRILDESRGPERAYQDGLKASRQLLDGGLISLKQYTDGLRDLRIEYLRTKTDMGSGLELGKLSVQKDNENVAGRAASTYQNEWNNANSGLRNIVETQQVLQQLMRDDPINSGTYAQRLRETQIEWMMLKGSMPDANFAEGVRGQLARFVQDFKGIIPGLSQAWGDFFTKFADGAANSIGRAVAYGENLGQVLRNVARDAIASLISALVKLALQWVIMKVLGIGSMGATTGASVAAGAATAAAWAPAAAMVSLATFGANAGPAMAGIAITNALSMGFAAVGAAAGVAGGAGSAAAGLRAATGGLINGPGSGTSDSVPAWLSNGEFVVNAASTAAFLPLLMAINGKRQARGSSFAVGGMVSGGAKGGKGAVPGGVNVTVENHSSAQVDVQEDTDGRIRILVREEVRRAGPAMMASQVADPYSPVSKSMDRHLKVARRRG